MEGRDVGSVTNLRYHLVLTTKYLRPALQGIEQSVYDAFREASPHPVILNSRGKQTDSRKRGADTPYHGKEPPRPWTAAHVYWPVTFLTNSVPFWLKPSPP